MDRIAEKDRNVSSVSLNNSVALEERGRPKKKPTFFTKFQRRQLIKAFKQDQYPCTQVKETLASSIGLSAIQVETWFRHQRAKWRRDNGINSSNILDNTSSSQRKYRLRRKRREFFTNFQQKQLEKTFEKNQYPSVKARENLAFKTGRTVNQINVWFQNRRYKYHQSQQNNIATRSNTLPVNQTDQPKAVEMAEDSLHANNTDQLREVASSSRSSVDLSTAEIILKVVTLQNELDFERKKSAELNKTLTDCCSKLNNLSLEYNDIVADKDKVVRELEIERLKNNRLNERVEILTLKLTELEGFKKKISQALNQTTLED